MNPVATRLSETGANRLVTNGRALCLLFFLLGGGEFTRRKKPSANDTKNGPQKTTAAINSHIFTANAMNDHSLFARSSSIHHE